MYNMEVVVLRALVLDVKAHQIVSMAADWREQRRWSCCGVREVSGVQVEAGNER